MKKFILSMAVVLAVALTSCESHSDKSVEEDTTVEAVTDTVAASDTVVDTVK